MSDKVQKLIENIVPFIVIGVGIAIVIALLFMFFYVAIWGVIIGGILWLGALAKEYFFPANHPRKNKEEL
ncbi:hypothetical protein PGH44_12690 [Legionella pneumophila]|nr:hypothetical protein PGH44_12690 [Legionella pneumophila]